MGDLSVSKNRQWILDARPMGNLTGKEFVWNEASIPKPADGQVLVRNLWLSFDPTQRGWMARDSYVPMVRLGEVMRASGVGQVIESRHPEFKPGDVVQGWFGWQDYIATDGRGLGGLRKLPPGVPPNTALSLFGITGNTAYFGITDIGQVKAGETVVVSGAAGSTGSVAGQIAKINGCRVIGTAGGKEKCDWLVEWRVSTPRLITRVRTLVVGFRRSAPMGLMCSSITSAASFSMRCRHASPQSAHRTLRRDLAIQRDRTAAGSIQLL